MRLNSSKILRITAIKLIQLNEEFFNFVSYIVLIEFERLWSLDFLKTIFKVSLSIRYIAHSRSINLKTSLSIDKLSNY